jgi:glycosyltransferase involved in cell wall biosynthesis
MRIVLISAEYPPVTGGVADYTYQLAHALARLGHRVAVLTTAAGNGRTAVEQDGSGVEVVSRVQGWGVRNLTTIGQIVRELAPDMVDLQYVPQMYGRGGLAPGIALLPLVLRMRTRATILCTLHEIASPWSFSPRRVAATAVHWAQMFSLLLAGDRFIVTNRRYAAQLRRWLRHPSSVYEIPVGATIMPVALGATERRELRRSIGLDDGVLVGDLSPYNVSKRPEDLIVILRSLGPRARLLLLGGLEADRTRRPQFIRLATEAGVIDRITWIDNLAAAQLSRYLSALDVYVHTAGVGASTRSTSLVSALAHGLAAVAYRGPETSDAFVDGGNILLVQPGESRSLAEGVRRLIDDPVLKARVATGAIDFHANALTWESIARQVLRAAE